MNKIRKGSLAAVAFIASLSVTPSASAAGSVGASLITNIQINTATFNGTSITYALVNFVSSTGTGRATCTIAPNGMAIDATTAKGKAVLSIATAALLAGKKVSATGTNGCLGGATSASFEIIQNITVLQ